jgi:hypothetical protein
MTHLIVNNALSIVPGGGGMAAWRRRQRRVHGATVLQNYKTDDGKSNEIHGSPSREGLIYSPRAMC